MRTAARRFSLAFLFAVLLLPLSARAGEFPAYEGGAFRAAQEAGRPILVHVHAEW